MEQSRFDIQYAAMRAAIIEREFQHLNEKQREAVFHTEGPLLVLAGAFSAQNAHTHRVKRTCPNIFGKFFSQCALQAALNFLCSFIGKCNRQNLPWAGGIDAAQGLCAHAMFFRRIAQVFSQKQQIIFCGVLRRICIGISLAKSQNIDDAID